MIPLHELSPDELERFTEAAAKEGITDISRLDAGGVGIVFSGVEVAQQKRVAVKVLRRPYDEERWLKRFRREAEILSRLEHPGLVRVQPPGLRVIAGFQTYVMEYVDGTSLKALLEKRGPLSEEEARTALRAAVEVLGHVHEHGVIHRDLHSGNLLLPADRLKELKLADFGTARDYTLRDMSASDVYETFHPLGAMSHCAPEKWMSPHMAGAESDIFSLGVLFFQATTGQHPYTADSYVKLYEKICSGAHRRAKQLQPKLSGEFDAILEAMLIPSQIFRISNCKLLLKRLDG